MNGKCYDIGTIQAFLDGELSPDLSAKVTNHAAACDACAIALADAEEQSAIVFSALEREFNTLVPTQRLWSKINDSITVEREKTPSLRKLWNFVMAQLASPSLAVAAAVLVVFSIFTAVWTLRSGESNIIVPDVAVNAPQAPPAVTMPLAGDSVTSAAPAPAAKRETARNSIRDIAVRADYRENSYRPKPTAESTRPAAATLAYMPGEESYVKTIATMSQSVNSQKNDVMRPSEQIAFERDLAVVNDSIRKMRKEVRKNPLNESAKQVLYSSYQNKIDLLNSVTQRQELMASLK
jgi:Putative zinc-finger